MLPAPRVQFTLLKKAMTQETEDTPAQARYPTNQEDLLIKNLHLKGTEKEAHLALNFMF